MWPSPSVSVPYSLRRGVPSGGRVQSAALCLVTASGFGGLLVKRLASDCSLAASLAVRAQVGECSAQSRFPGAGPGRLAVPPHGAFGSRAL